MCNVEDIVMLEIIIENHMKIKTYVIHRINDTHIVLKSVWIWNIEQHLTLFCADKLLSACGNPNRIFEVCDLLKERLATAKPPPPVGFHSKEGI